MDNEERDTTPDIAIRDKRLLHIAKEHNRGLTTDEEFCDRVIEVVLVWLLKEHTHVA